MHHSSYYYYAIGVEIGFSSDHYNVTEGDGRVTIQVGIISSSLQPGMTIPLTITLESETATSKFLLTGTVVIVSLGPLTILAQVLWITFPSPMGS